MDKAFVERYFIIEVTKQMKMEIKRYTFCFSY